MDAIRFENVNVSFAQQAVLQDFSMTVRPAETKVILGGSGSGKTTILKLVLGLVKPDSGRIYVQDQDITELSEVKLMPIRRQMGMVFQEAALFDSMSVGENVAYQMREEGELSEGEIFEAVRKVLGFVGLEGAIDLFPSELSGGMRRRVGIARSLVGNPGIMLYDEPTAGLDPITARTICELIMTLRDLQDVSSILVTHDLKTAMTLASEHAESNGDGRVVFRAEGEDYCLLNTRFLMLKEGRACFEGTDEEIKGVDDAYIREFLT